ncbi:MAG: helix-turn-helix domain-containing protein [Clostridia bacterium]|nr:helix-turn-helix domain-containing protein [Clostridia bacterium]
MDIQFHCFEDSSFDRQDQFVRAFLYKDYSIVPHSHDFYEINIVINGTGIHQIMDSKISVKAGDVFVIPPQISHAYYNTNSLDVCHVIIKNEFIRNNQRESLRVPGYLHLMEIEPYLRQKTSQPMFLNLNLSQLSELQQELKFIEDTSVFNSECYSGIQSHSVWKFIYYLSYLFDRQINKDSNKNIKSNVQILNTLEFIHQHFSEKITINSLAERVFLSRSTFLRNFQAVCGCSPIHYLNQYRLQKASELLKSSSLSKTEIAQCCGFYDLSHMLRLLNSKSISISVREQNNAHNNHQ